MGGLGRPLPPLLRARGAADALGESVLDVRVAAGVTPETAKAVAELADAMGIPEDEVVARAVTCLGIMRAVLWAPGMAARAVDVESPHE